MREERLPRLVEQPFPHLLVSLPRHRVGVSSYVGESRSHDELRRLALVGGPELEGWLCLGPVAGGFCLA